ncbi:uncharacterized protein LOC143289925 isoform X2 [Babylonia areolata]|uniref:uncharacterized protein LOC143289925 isoform X2 n=1 Tax=Babylonia areolata TaxID=304850 RepID=UPI003FD51FE9
MTLVFKRVPITGSGAEGPSSHREDEGHPSWLPDTSKGPSLDQLPTEVLDSIISKLDGRSVACALGVNSRWREIVYNLSSAFNFNIWFRICLKEVGLDAMIAQTGLTWLATKGSWSKAKLEAGRWEFWRALYAANVRCQEVNMLRWRVSHDQYLFKSEGRDVTVLTSHQCGLMHVCSSPQLCCCGGKGRTMVGFRDGHTSCFNMLPGFGRISQPSQGFLKHMSSCSSAAFLTLGGGCPGFSDDASSVEMVVVSSSPSGDLMVTDMDSFLSYPLLEDHRQRVHCLSSLGPYFAIGSNHSQLEGVVVYQLTKKQGSYRAQPVLRLLGSLHSDMQTVALAYNKVVAGDQKGNLYLWQFPPLCGDEEEGKGGREPQVVGAPSNKSLMRSGIAQLLLHQGFVVVLSKPGHPRISWIDTKKWEMRFSMCGKDICAVAPTCYNPISLAACGCLLAVGLQSGMVLVFNMASEKQPPGNIVHKINSELRNLVTLNFTHGPWGPTLVIGGDGLALCQILKN